MKGIARIGVSILGLYLILQALSLLAARYWFGRMDIPQFVVAFGPATILLFGGIVCLVFRDRISSWILTGQRIDIPSEVNLEQIECVILSLIGVFVFSRAVGASGIAIVQFIAAYAEATDAVRRPVKSMVYAQTVAVLVRFCLACILIFFPHRVQALLRKTRGF